MRTNIVLDDKLIERAQKLTGIKTKREVVHEALRLLILLNEQGEVRTLSQSRFDSECIIPANSNQPEEHSP